MFAWGFIIGAPGGKGIGQEGGIGFGCGCCCCCAWIDERPSSLRPEPLLLGLSSGISSGTTFFSGASSIFDFESEETMTKPSDLAGLFTVASIVGLLLG